MSTLDSFLATLRPLLTEHRAEAAYLFGSHARGEADSYSDIDCIIVGPTERPPVDRFHDYLPAILAAGTGVDLFVYTREEFERMKAEQRPFLMHALENARQVYARQAA